MYALKLSDNGRICVLVPPQCEEFAPIDYLRLENIPDNVTKSLSDYRYVDKKFIFDPLPEIVPKETNSEIDDIYTALTELAEMIGG